MSAQNFDFAPSCPKSKIYSLKCRPSIFRRKFFNKKILWYFPDNPNLLEQLPACATPALKWKMKSNIDLHHTVYRPVLSKHHLEFNSRDIVVVCMSSAKPVTKQKNRSNCTTNDRTTTLLLTVKRIYRLHFKQRFNQFTPHAIDSRPCSLHCHSFVHVWVHPWCYRTFTTADKMIDVGSKIPPLDNEGGSTSAERTHDEPASWMFGILHHLNNENNQLIKPAHWAHNKR